MKLVYLMSAAAILMAGSAQAAESTVSNNQNNSANIKSRIGATIQGVNDSVSLTSAAIANTMTLEGGQADYLGNFQFFRGDSVAELNGTITNVSGDVNATAAAIANSATISVD